jgi:hypothetical protein
MLRPLASVVLAPLLFACGYPYTAYAGAAGERASIDFACAREDLHETHLTGTSYELRGCGHEASYTCVLVKGYVGRIIPCLREGNVTTE